MSAARRNEGKVAEGPKDGLDDKGEESEGECSSDEYSTARSESEVLYRASLSGWQGFDRWISRGPNQGERGTKKRTRALASKVSLLLPSELGAVLVDGPGRRYLELTSRWLDRGEMTTLRRAIWTETPKSTRTGKAVAGKEEVDEAEKKIGK